MFLEYLKENFYTRDFLIKMKYLFKNLKLDSMIKTCSKIDSIQDYHAYRNFILETVKPYLLDKQSRGFLAKLEFGCEGLHYGYRKAFFDYAGVTDRQARFLLPGFEHGVNFSVNFNLTNHGQIENHSFVTQSAYKNDMIHAILPYRPVYNIGPYILYAKSYYDENKLQDLKRHNGKTIVFFPAHAYERSDFILDESKFVDNIIHAFEKDYNTILICAYWNDLEHSIYEKFEAAGAKLVSAGFRGDQKFVNRLKTIIELSDVVCSNREGTYVGYALALGKPFLMIGDRGVSYSYEGDNIITEEAKKRYTKMAAFISEAFSNLEPTEKQKQMQYDFFIKFYGGKELFKTAEQARSIISLQRKLVKASAARASGIEEIVKKIVEGRNIIDLDSLEYDEFKKAIPNF